MGIQTILGGGGTIANLLAKELRNYTDEIRLISRNPRPIHPEDECVTADILNANELDQAIAGTEIVYLTVGFPYQTKLWETVWPIAMQNTLDTCSKHQAKLVFFDNTYMYAKEDIHPARENSRIDPPSRKGKVRAKVAQMALNAHKAGQCEVMIVRAPGFYGPQIERNSMITETVIKNLQKGKAAFWFCDADVPHASIYTPDAAKATALLGNTADAYGEVWHLPCAENPPTGRQWIEKFAEAFDAKPKISVMSPFLVGLLGFVHSHIARVQGNAVPQ